MPNKQNNRGPHPQDEELFADDQLPHLRAAVADLAWLLTRNYTINPSLKLVGDRYALRARQRIPVSRGVCSDDALLSRERQRLELADLAGERIGIDGFNLIITVEAALSGSFLFVGRDGAVRDIASIHGSYRRVRQTDRAVELIAQYLEKAQLGNVCWYLDRPVSNSGRLRTRLLELAQENAWEWDVEVVNNPDKTLVQEEQNVASADSWVIDNSPGWINLAAEVVTQYVSTARVIDLRQNPSQSDVDR